MLLVPSVGTAGICARCLTTRQLLPGERLLLLRQQYGEGGPNISVVRCPNTPAMLGYNAFGDIESQTAAAAARFCRKEGVEDMVYHVCRNAIARITH